MTWSFRIEYETAFVSLLANSEVVKRPIRKAWWYLSYLQIWDLTPMMQTQDAMKASGWIN